MGTGKHPPQTLEEMKAEMIEKRDNPNPKSRIYKVQADEHRNEVLAATVRRGSTELIEATEREKISLSDTDAVKQQTLVYLTACEQAGTLPTFIGLARSLGYTRRSLYDAIESRTRPETADFLQMFSDMCSDLLSESALANNVNFTYAIFIQKAIHGLRESVEIIARPAAPLGDSQDIDTISRKYIEALPTADDNNE